MDLIGFVFGLARNISDGDLDEVNKLHNKAKDQVSKYASDEKGLKGLYAKAHKGWVFPTLLIFALPMATAYFHKMKNRMMNEQLMEGGIDQQEGGFEDLIR